MNISKNIDNLLIVLSNKGKIYRINTFKKYKDNTYITKYEVYKLYEEKYRKELETYRQIDVMMFLVKEYG